MNEWCLKYVENCAAYERLNGYNFKRTITLKVRRTRIEDQILKRTITSRLWLAVPGAVSNMNGTRNMYSIVHRSLPSAQCDESLMQMGRYVEIELYYVCGWIYVSNMNGIYNMYSIV